MLNLSWLCHNLSTRTSLGPFEEEYSSLCDTAVLHKQTSTVITLLYIGHDKKSKQTKKGTGAFA